MPQDVEGKTVVMGHIKIDENSRKPHRLYVCGVSWLYEIEQGITGFSRIKDLYNYHSYASQENFPQDGIVEVELRFIRHIPAEKCWEEKQKND